MVQTLTMGLLCQIIILVGDHVAVGKAVYFSSPVRPANLGFKRLGAVIREGASAISCLRRH